MIFARFGDKKQTRRQNMAEIVFSRGGGGLSEIKCIIFKENNDNPYDNPHDNFLGEIRKFDFCQAY